MSTMREVPAPTRGSGPVECCGGHRKRCLFGDIHHWGTWYENGRLQRTKDTVYCHRCGGVCTGDEEAPADPVSVWQGELSMSGITLRAHVLSDGSRVIEAADLEALMEAWGRGVPVDEEEAAAFARWQRGASDDEEGSDLD